MCEHPDIRIFYQNEIQHYSLSEFEAAELHETGTTGDATANDSAQAADPRINGISQPSVALSTLKGALRERLLEEGQSAEYPATFTRQAPALEPQRQLPRAVSENLYVATAIFDKPEPTVTAPRLYASQNRIWQALTGHGIDLKRVPSMEFVLLSLIAARGSDGIAQPDLTMLSGQDKRSVPHRTDELARKGYISKNPVQAGKIRTSLCVHSKFISQDHFLSSGAVEDVYKEGTFVLSSFVNLLYNKLSDAGIVPTRDIRTRLVI